MFMAFTWRTSLEKFGKMSDRVGSLGVDDVSVRERERERGE